MRRSYKLASICAVSLLFMCLPAFADSNDNFSNVQLQGASGTVSGSFTFNSQTDRFSNVSISFVSPVFGTVNVNLGNFMGQQGWNGLWGFKWWGLASNGDFVQYNVTLNANGTFQVSGGIADWQGDHGTFNYLSVPEGGARLSYLTLSGLAILAGIFVSGKQRRAPNTVRPV